MGNDHFHIASMSIPYTLTGIIFSEILQLRATLTGIFSVTLQWHVACHTVQVSNLACHIDRFHVEL